PRLRGWIDEARDDLLTRRRLAAATTEWLDAGADPSFLYGGGRLDVVETWAGQTGVALTENERRFLTTSPGQAAPAAAGRPARPPVAPARGRPRRPGALAPPPGGPPRSPRRPGLEPAPGPVRPSWPSPKTPSGR